MFKALILAAGVGRRLQNNNNRLPKCLLPFGGKSLLERHIKNLVHLGIKNITIVTGYGDKYIQKEIIKCNEYFQVSIKTVYNPDYQLGSIMSLSCLHHEINILRESPLGITKTNEFNLAPRVREPNPLSKNFVLMDADVLYDHRLLEQLILSKHKNCFLVDRRVEANDSEAVKLCVRDGSIVEFRKKVSVSYDYLGESVGFFRFSQDTAAKIIKIAKLYLAKGNQKAPYEEAIREVLLDSPHQFGFEDITNFPWIEIDFSEDIVRAEKEILPLL